MLLLIPRFGTGGATKVGCLLANLLHGSALNVAVATYGPHEGEARRLLDRAVPIVPLTQRKGASRSWLAATLALPGLVAALRSGRPSILLSAGNHANVVAAVAHGLAGARRTALVLKLTNPLKRSGRGALRSGIKTAVYRVAIRKAAGVLVLSSEDRQALVDLAPDAADKVHVVQNPYLERSPEEDPGAAPQTPEPLLLSVGRLTEQKNVELLLAALARLADRPWRLRILGVGPRQEALETLAANLGLAERVTFAGYVADPAPYYRQAHALIIASRWEGLPAAAVESLAAGCPVIATDCSPALTRLVEASAAGAVARQTPEDLAAAIGAALAAGRGRPRPEAVQGYRFDEAAQSHMAALHLAMRRLSAAPA